MCSCICGVFVGGGKFKSLLYHHLGDNTNDILFVSVH